MIPRTAAIGRIAGLIIAASVVLTACSSAADPLPSFDPSTPCGGADEQRMRGAYPELEALVPRTLAGVPATTRDSGRLCSKASLGALAEAGVEEMHFGGGTWDKGSGKGLSLVVFEANGLTANGLFDSYVVAARANSQNHDIKTSQPTISAIQTYRMDLVAGESFETLVVWPGDRAGRVRVLLTADQSEADIQAAIEAFS